MPPTKTGLTPPKHTSEVKVAFPARHVLLLTLNRPKSLNAMTPTMTEDMKMLLNWFEEEPELWVLVITGEGRIFCAGADLIAWNKNQQSNTSNETEEVLRAVHGFGSVSRRQSMKPIIAAVNGGAYGGGMEIVLNCDLVVAADDAKFALPEVKRGVVAIQGGIPRLTQIVGHQRASEMLLTGKSITAVDARDRFGFVNTLVPASSVVSSAIALAQQIAANSPDAVQSTKHALILSQRLGHSETLFQHVQSPESKLVYKGQNIKEGLKAFTEKRSPVWSNPAKL